MKPSGLIALQVLVVVLVTYYPSSVTSEVESEDLEALQAKVENLKASITSESNACLNRFDSISASESSDCIALYELLHSLSHELSIQQCLPITAQLCTIGYSSGIV